MRTYLAFARLAISNISFKIFSAENCDPNGAAALLPGTNSSESKEPFYENGVHLSGVSPPLVPPSGPLIPPSSPTNLIILNTPSSPTVALQPLVVVTGKGTFTYYVRHFWGLF